jgi:hypothetical protein
MNELEYKVDPKTPAFLSKIYKARVMGFSKSPKGLKRFYISDYMFKNIKDSMPEPHPKNTELTIYNIPVTPVKNVKYDYLDFSIDWSE